MSNLNSKTSRVAVVALLSLWATMVSPSSRALLSFTSQQTTPSATLDLQLKRIHDGIQAKLDRVRATNGFPGATATFVLPDGRSSSVSTGISDLKTKRPLVPSDLMLAGSIGKTFVAAVMIQLAQEGKVNRSDAERNRNR